MPYSLYVDNDSACCIFHPRWHSHSCLCWRDVVAIKLLWLRDSLIVWMGGLVVKSIECSEWFFASYKAVVNIAVIVKSNWQIIRAWEVDGWNLLGGEIQPLLTLGVSGSRVGWGTSWLWVQASEEGEQWVMCGLCAIYLMGIKNFSNILKSSRFLIQIFLKLQFSPESNKKFPAKYFFKLWLFPPESVLQNVNGGTFFFENGRLLLTLHTHRNPA